MARKGWGGKKSRCNGPAGGGNRRIKDGRAFGGYGIKDWVLEGLIVGPLGGVGGEGGRSSPAGRGANWGRERKVNLRCGE